MRGRTARLLFKRLLKLKFSINYFWAANSFTYDILGEFGINSQCCENTNKCKTAGNSDVINAPLCPILSYDVGVIITEPC
jgi:hypothetical protein